MRIVDICTRVVPALLTWLMLAAGPVDGQVFLPDDPIWEDPDRLDVPKPEPQEIGDFYDFWLNTFGTPAEYEGPAVNVSTIGEVPNSSWYENRHYRHPMTPEELSRGPNSGDGPSVDGKWKVVAGKSEGKTPGMQIEDSNGDRYLLKFDAPGAMELTSGAEVISTKILFALGYHVPENYIVRFPRSRLVPGEEAMLETAGGDERPIDEAAIGGLLAGVPQYEDGSYRALASKFLKGDPLGPFFYFGTRPDDGNDIYPHEGRRELRGLRLAAAWINHSDARSVNTLDTYVEEEGRRFVRHHLIDFGSTLGAAAVGAKRRWDGYEYIVDGEAILLRTATLGLAGLGWAAIEYPDRDALGRIDARHFDPEEWRPQYPNPAFVRCDAADAFWAARQIASFDDEALMAIVATAQYTDPEDARRITEILQRRRDRIARQYLGFGGGLDRFDIVDGALVFEDVRVNHGLVEAAPMRHIIWRPFDNGTGESGTIISAGDSRDRSLAVPDSGGRFVSAEIRTPGDGVTTVYLRRSRGTGWEVVGLERR